MFPPRLSLSPTSHILGEGGVGSQRSVRRGKAKVTEADRDGEAGWVLRSPHSQLCSGERARATHRRDHLADGLPKGRFHSTP